MSSLLFAVGPASAGEGAPDPRESSCAVDFDVLFVFDTTGSMGGVLNDAQSGAGSVMSAVQAQVPGAAFGVADYRDYPSTYVYPGYASSYGGPGDYPWKLLQPINTNIAASTAAIATLAAGGGNDWPESLTRAAFESYSDPGVAWRPGSVRIVVVFTDAPAHDEDFAGNDFGGDPGPDGIALTADDLDFQAVVAGADAAGIRYAGIGVGGNGGAAYLQYMAAETNGEYAVLGADFVTQMTALILELGGVRMEAHADALLVDIVSVASNYLDVAHVEAGPHVDAHTETFNTLTLPNALNGYLKTGEGSAATSQPAGARKATARETIERVSILGGFVQASLLRSEATVLVNAGGAYPSVGQTQIVDLIVNGIPVSGGSSQNISIPGIGYVSIRETIINQPTWDTAEVEVNMIHVFVDTPGLVADIKVSHAYAGVMCQSGHHDGPTPPIDPADPVDPVGPVGPVPPVDPRCINVATGNIEICPASPPCTRELLGRSLSCLDPVTDPLAPTCIEIGNVSFCLDDPTCSGAICVVLPQTGA